MSKVLVTGGSGSSGATSSSSFSARARGPRHAAVARARSERSRDAEKWRRRLGRAGVVRRRRPPARRRLGRGRRRLRLRHPCGVPAAARRSEDRGRSDRAGARRCAARPQGGAPTRRSGAWCSPHRAAPSTTATAQTAPFDETSWTNLGGDMSAYVRSKAIAERAAWSFMAAEGGALELAVVIPRASSGRCSGPTSRRRSRFVKRLMNGGPGCPQLYFGVVDVRDVADLHLRAMTDPAAKASASSPSPARSCRCSTSRGC